MPHDVRSDDEPPHPLKPTATWRELLGRAAAASRDPPAPVGAGADPASLLGEELTRSWIASLAPREPEKLARRLRWDGIEAAALHRLLKLQGSSAPASPIDDSVLLANLCQAARAAADHPLIPPGDTGFEADASVHRAFVDLWAPAAKWALQELRRSLSPGPRFDVAERTWQGLEQALLSRLCQIGEHALWELFNQERGPRAFLLAHLDSAEDGSGALARGQYERFVRHHRADGLRELFSTYPVLGRLVGTVTDLWLRACSEMLRRLEGDRPALAETFGIPVRAALAQVKLVAGDPHRGGRSVAVLGFASETARFEVVYKPKDLSLDATYQAVLAGLNAASGLPALRTLRVLRRAGYGYMEFLPHRPCSGEEELRRFYRNAGRLTALLHVLGCTDCHHENLIAHGDQLVLIDTETLLEADLASRPDDDQPPPAPSERSARLGLWDRINSSVLRSGLLPQWMFVGEGRLAMDISALGIAPPENAVEKSWGWTGLNSDAMVAALVDRRTELPTSLPVGSGHGNPLDRHLEGLCAGFREQCEALIQLRPGWLGKDGELARFSGLPRRVVLRSTRIYFAIQRQLLAPSSLHSELAQGLKLEQLARTHLLSDDRPDTWPLFWAEVRQMEQLDIPFFSQLIDSSELPLPDGMEPIRGFTSTSSRDAARRLNGLDAAEIDFQLRLVRGSIEARLLRADPQVAGASAAQPLALAPSGAGGAAPRPGAPGLDQQARLAAARDLARQITGLAISDGGGRHEWLGMNLGQDGQKFTYGPVGLSLYSGAMGIAVFLACCQASLGPAASSPAGPEFAPTVHGLVRPLVELAERGGPGLMRWWRDQPLGLAGSGGILLALFALDQLGFEAPEGAESHRSVALELRQGLRPDRVESDQALDLMHGVTGLIGPLLMLGDPESLELAARAGDHLAKRQQPSGGWVAAFARAQPPLTGWSHGAAAMAAALARLHRHTGEHRHRQAAREALEYEHRAFVAQAGNWPDFRAKERGFMVAWCHGAPGIALSRLCLMGTELWDSQAEQDVRTAVATTASQRLAADHLCCGRFGLVAILRMVAGRCQAVADQAREAARNLEAEALADAKFPEGRFSLFGTQEGSVVLPGLMTGLAGIGLVLLDGENSRRTLATLLGGGLLFPESTRRILGVDGIPLILPPATAPMSSLC